MCGVRFICYSYVLFTSFHLSLYTHLPASNERIALNTPKSARSALRPVPIINALSQPIPGSSSGRTKWFASREHQDAQELFQLLSECIKSEAQAVDAEAQRDRGQACIRAEARARARDEDRLGTLLTKQRFGQVSGR